MLTMMVNGVTTIKIPDTEQYKYFTRKIGRKAEKYCQYDYRCIDDVLFSYVKKALEECSAARDSWLAKR